MIRNPPWDEKTAERAIELWQQKVSGTKIAQELGSTRSAVMGKLRRLGQMGKGAPPSTPGKVSRETGSFSIRPRVRSDGLPFAKPRDLPLPSDASRRSFNTVSGPSYSLLDLHRGDCHWPIGDPVNEPDLFCYCAAPTCGKTEYCAEHLQVMWSYPKR